MNGKLGLLKIIGLVLSAVFMSCSTQVKAPKPMEVIPSVDQLKWQELEYYMFIHFGPNTFTDVEWGDGKEDPKLFNPTALDARQWASVARDAGMQGIVITAKHHDGFCLWPSQYSTHTVRESGWKNGSGDVLKDLSDACREYNLKFGVYLSPWDQNHPTYGKAEYNQIFAKTLEEVLSNYGEVFEQWFDGANGGNLEHKYDWDLFHSVVYKHQPHAVIFSDVGPGCRWIGNEQGVAGENNWSRLNIKGFNPGAEAPAPSILNQGQADGEVWIPGEVDVSIRPGWFYSPKTDNAVKTVGDLMGIYYTSVGRNANLLLNVPPDRRGRIHPADSLRLMEFRDARKKAFKVNLAKGVRVTASATRGNADDFSANNMIDNDKDTYWTTNENVTEAIIEINFKESTKFNRLLLQEHVALGQRIGKFNVEIWDSSINQWKEIASGTTVGYKRILCFDQVEALKLRINIMQSFAEPILNNLEIYYDSQEYLNNRVIDGKSIQDDILGKVQVRTKYEGTSIDMNGAKEIKGFSFIPLPSNESTTIQRYDFSVSSDLKNWDKVISNGIFNNIKNSRVEQRILLDKPVKASYIRLDPVQLTDKDAESYEFLSFEAIE